MSRLIMLPCAAFLRVYEPLSAFGRTERARWEAYAASADRPRRADALEAEREEALRRIIALPPIVAPARESDHAYVRWPTGPPTLARGQPGPGPGLAPGGRGAPPG